MHFFINCTILDTKIKSIRDNCYISVENGIVTDVGNMATLEVSALPTTTTVEDMYHKYVMAGLIDAHCHIFEEPDPELYKGFRYDEDETTAISRALSHLETFYRSGITTLREMGAIDRRNILIKNFISNYPRLPSIVSCGNPITHPTGHFVSRCRHVTGVDQMKTAVDEEVANGADFIKINNTSDLKLSFEELRVAVETAKELGTFVACHSYTFQAMSIAIDAGVKSLEHVAEFDDSLLEKMTKKDVVAVPTHVAAFDSIPGLHPEANTEILLTEIPDATLNDFIEWYNWQIKNLPNLFKSGVKMAIGTDCGFVPTGFDSIHREMTLLVNLGATTWQVLQAATLGSAIACGIDREVGTIEVGKKADLLVLNNNPIEDITNTLDIFGVALRGDFEKF